MNIKVYTSSTCGNLQVRKCQQLVTFLFSSLGVTYEEIDISDVRNKTIRDNVLETVKIMGKSKALPYVFVNDEYAANYDEIEVANELGELGVLLKLPGAEKKREVSSQDAKQESLKEGAVTSEENSVTDEHKKIADEEAELHGNSLDQNGEENTDSDSVEQLQGVSEEDTKDDAAKNEHMKDEGLNLDDTSEHKTFEVTNRHSEKDDSVPSVDTGKTLEENPTDSNTQIPPQPTSSSKELNEADDVNSKAETIVKLDCGSQDTKVPDISTDRHDTTVSSTAEKKPQEVDNTEDNSPCDATIEP